MKDFIHTFYVYLAGITFLASLLMIVLAVYVYMTSNGDAGKIKTAREYLTNAIIGLVVVGFAYLFFSVFKLMPQ